jgi:hypothetical protein
MSCVDSPRRQDRRGPPHPKVWPPTDSLFLQTRSPALARKPGRASRATHPERKTDYVPKDAVTGGTPGRLQLPGPVFSRVAFHTPTGPLAASPNPGPLNHPHLHPQHLRMAMGRRCLPAAFPLPRATDQARQPSPHGVCRPPQQQHVELPMPWASTTGQH